MGKKRFTDLHPESGDAADSAVFRAAVRDVVPLTQVHSAAGLAKPRPVARKRRPPPSATEDLDASMPLLPTADGGEAASLDDAIAGDSALSFHRGGVRIQVMRRLKRGLFPSEDELDLHGLTQTAARDRLADFLVRSRDAGCRCVRVIHGKGYRSGARGPILKTAVNLWLRRHIDVMAFASARTIDGGTGAVYVLLRG
jgi:DNA-nicking Smr family endonuclease